MRSSLHRDPLHAFRNRIIDGCERERAGGGTGGGGDGDGEFGHRRKTAVLPHHIHRHRGGGFFGASFRQGGGDGNGLRPVPFRHFRRIQRQPDERLVVQDGEGGGIDGHAGVAVDPGYGQSFVGVGGGVVGDGQIERSGSRILGSGDGDVEWGRDGVVGSARRRVGIRPHRDVHDGGGGAADPIGESGRNVHRNRPPVFIHRSPIQAKAEHVIVVIDGHRRPGDGTASQIIGSTGYRHRMVGVLQDGVVNRS